MGDGAVIPRTWAYIADELEVKACIRMVAYNEPRGNVLWERLHHLTSVSFCGTSNPGCFGVSRGTFIRPEVDAGTRYGKGEPRELEERPAYRWRAVPGVPWLYYGLALTRDEALDESRTAVP